MRIAAKVLQSASEKDLRIILMLMGMRIAAGLLLVSTICFGSDWDPKRAAEYLDSRQREWFAWPAAKADGGPCVSCHTGLTYLLARPALRQALHEKVGRPAETGLIAAMKTRVLASANSTQPVKKQTSVETVMLAFLLARDAAAAGTLTPESERVFDILWSRQITAGELRGTWDWYSLHLDPWETADSAYFGAAVAALAAGTAPSAYQDRPAVRDHLDALRSYLRSRLDSQPLHNRLMALWASTRLRGTLSAEQQESIRKAALDCQEEDGGWTISSLGPWEPHAGAPAQQGSNAYATALTAFVLQRAGVARSSQHIAHARQWLKTRQDPATGSWLAASQNKVYEPGSMQVGFMSDAASAFAVMALLDATPSR